MLYNTHTYNIYHITGRVHLLHGQDANQESKHFPGKNKDLVRQSKIAEKYFLSHFYDMTHFSRYKITYIYNIERKRTNIRFTQRS